MIGQHGPRGDRAEPRFPIWREGTQWLLTGYRDDRVGHCRWQGLNLHPLQGETRTDGVSQTVAEHSCSLYLTDSRRRSHKGSASRTERPQHHRGTREGPEQTRAGGRASGPRSTPDARGFAAGATRLAPSLPQATCRPQPSADSGLRPACVTETSGHGTAAPCRPAPLLLHAGPRQVVMRAEPCRTVPWWPACCTQHDVSGVRPGGLHVAGPASCLRLSSVQHVGTA